MKFYTAVFFFLIAFVCHSQDLIWTGYAGNYKKNPEKACC